MYKRTESYTGYTMFKNRSIYLLMSNFSFQRHSFQLLHQKSVEEEQLVQMIRSGLKSQPLKDYVFRNQANCIANSPSLYIHPYTSLCLQRCYPFVDFLLLVCNLSCANAFVFASTRGNEHYNFYYYYYMKVET